MPVDQVMIHFLVVLIGEMWMELITTVQLDNKVIVDHVMQ